MKMTLLLIALMVGATGCHSTGVAITSAREFTNAMLDDFRDLSDGIERMRREAPAPNDHNFD